MSSNRTITPSSLSLSDLPWQINWKKDRCTLCGQCTAVCPVQAIKLDVFRKRNLDTSLNPAKRELSGFETWYGIKQKTTIQEACIGCAMCSMVCPNDAIAPERNPGTERFKFHRNQNGEPRNPWRAKEQHRFPAGSDQVHPDFHAHRPCPGCRTS